MKNILKSRVFIIVIAVFLIISLFSIKQCERKKYIEKISFLEMSNFIANNARIDLEYRLKKLRIDYSAIGKANDSLKLSLKKSQRELSELIKTHAKEIEELLKVPNDTIFVRLQPLYPNYDNTLLQYPFSGSQIRGIYSTAISFDRVKQEYSLQTKSLNSCLTLNDGFEKGITNLNLQVTNLQDNVNNCDLQIKNYDRQITTLNKQVTKKTFWNRTLVGGIAVAVLVVVLK